MNNKKLETIMLAAASMLYLIAAVIQLTTGHVASGAACTLLVLIGVRGCFDAARDGWRR